MEGRVLLSVSAQADTPFRIVAITGNQQSDLSARYTDETLFDVKVGTPGSDPAFLDGFTAPAGAATTLTTVGEVPGAVPGLSDGITQGTGALRVDVPQDGTTFWGLRSPNVVDLLAFGTTNLSYELTLIGKELNGGSFAGADNSFAGYAQSNEMAINLSDGTWIQTRLADVGDDDTGLAGQWSGADRTHHITWDLNQFTAPDGSALSDYIAAHNITGAWFVLPTQGGENGSPNANGTQGPMRFYFDDFQLSSSKVDSLVGDFDPVATTKLVTLPFVPDTDAIGYNPDNGLLYRTSGASSYRDDPNRVGYNDNQFMETVDLNSPTFTQTGVFNANYEGDGGTGPYGLPAPRPTFVLPAERRTPDQTDPAIGNLVGEGEYDAARDLAWSPTEHLFYVAAHSGIYKLTPAGVSTKATGSTYGGEPKGITFATIDGERRLLVAQRNVGAISVIDTADMSEIGRITLTKAVTGDLIPGLVALEEGPDGMLYGVANKPDLPFQRDLVRIDPTTGETTTIGTLGLHVADIAIVPAAAPSGAADVYVRGDAWSTAFKQYLENKGMGDDAFGYKLVGNGAAVGGPPANPDQVLPWTNVNQVVLKYATAPTGAGVPNTSNLTVSSARGVSYTISSVTPVAGDPTAFVVTLNQPLGGGNPTTGVAPTASENGDRITLTVPSAGPGGAALTVRMNVLQGDVDHTGESGGTHTVLAADFSSVKKKFFKNTSDAATGADTDYSAFHDVNGSGDILANDFSEVKKRFFQELAPPPALSQTLAVSSITSDLFGSKQIL
jgi:hypothetical protein